VSDILFFDDEPLTLRRKAVLKQLPPTPNTGWLPPTHFPNLSAAKLLSFDCETWEPDFDHGPGWARGKGHIVGVGIGADDGNGNYGKWYFPVRHEVEPQYNLDPIHVFNYVRDTLERTPNIPKVGANLTYDVGWLGEENIHVKGELHDVQFAEALLSEDTEVNLGHLGVKYLNENKTSDDMYRWQAEAYGGSANSNQRANIYRTSPRLVGHYGEGDVDLPLRILRHQWPAMEREGVLNIYRMECDLISLMVAMRRKGVTIDLPMVEQLYAQLGLDIMKFHTLLKNQLGFELNVNAGDSVAKAFDYYGVPYMRTAAGKPSFTKDFLKQVEHPIGKQIIELRMYEKIRNTFIRSYLLERHTNGKIHASFNQLRSDDGGTIVGRYSSSDPNLQNIPVRPGFTEEPLLTKPKEGKPNPLYDPTYVPLGKRMRSCFRHDFGDVEIEKIDFSQIQYRYLVHDAVGDGAQAVADAYNLDPNTDYHDIVQKLVNDVSGRYIERKPIKNINFGLAFGMGEDKLARQLGVELSVAREIMKAYHMGAPYVRETTKLFARMALEDGQIVSMLGRKSRFNLWEPIRERNSREERKIALPYERALAMYGTRIQRAYGHKALNRKLQMAEGDHMKRGMWQCWKEGVFDYIGVPRLTVHDELVFSVMRNDPAMNEAFAYMRHVMTHAVSIKIPVLVDFGRGANWGAID